LTWTQFCHTILPRKIKIVATKAHCRIFKHRFLDGGWIKGVTLVVAPRSFLPLALDGSFWKCRLFWERSIAPYPGRLDCL